MDLIVIVHAPGAKVLIGGGHLAVQNAGDVFSRHPFKRHSLKLLIHAANHQCINVIIIINIIKIC